MADKKKNAKPASSSPARKAIPARAKAKASSARRAGKSAKPTKRGLAAAAQDSSQASKAAPRARSQPRRGRPAEAPEQAPVRSRSAARRSIGTGKATSLRSRSRVAPAAVAARRVAAALGDEERIESAKYDSFEQRRRVFEEERFLFPASYDSDRVRLLVKDPEWLFAHWDVSPASLGKLREELGERALSLSRLTLKIEDPSNGALSFVLLPEGARSWYVRTHEQHRAYRAQLGVTTPSGEFRSLATSNVVGTPRVGPSHRRATRRVSFRRGEEARAAAEASRGAGSRRSRARARATPVAYIDGTGGPQPAAPTQLPQRGGASDVFGPGGEGGGPGGASDVYRR